MHPGYQRNGTYSDELLLAPLHPELPPEKEMSIACHEHFHDLAWHVRVSVYVCEHRLFVNSEHFFFKVFGGTFSYPSVWAVFHSGRSYGYGPLVALTANALQMPFPSS